MLDFTIPRGDERLTKGGAESAVHGGKSPGPKAALWLAGRRVSSLVSSGKVDEADAETHGMFHGEQQSSDRSEKIVAVD
jgi:hypothetical protein